MRSGIMLFVLAALLTASSQPAFSGQAGVKKAPKAAQLVAGEELCPDNAWEDENGCSGGSSSEELWGENETTQEWEFQGCVTCSDWWSCPDGSWGENYYCE